MRALGVAVAATRPPVPHWAAPTWRGATPQAEGLLRVRTQVCFHTPAPVPRGRSRSINPYAGRRFERRFEAAGHPFADRPAVWQPGITEQSRGIPDGSGHSPSRQVRDAPVPSDRWPSRTGLLDGSDLPTEGGWPCTSNPPRCRTRHRKRGSLPPRPHPPERHRRSSGRGATAMQPATCGTAGAHMEAAFSCTCTPMSMCTRGTPPTPGDRRSRSTSRKSARTPSRIAIDHRSGARTGARTKRVAAGSARVPFGLRRSAKLAKT